jgi:PBP1b-binding outer membrane lipoprotein LpoB
MEKKMKKILYLLPLFLSILACGTQSLPAQDVNKRVNATLTAIAQKNLQVTALQPTFTPISIQAQPIIPTPVVVQTQPVIVQVQPTAIQQVEQQTTLSLDILCH